MPENPTVTGYVGTALIQATVGEATGQFGTDNRTTTTAIAQKIRFITDAGELVAETPATVTFAGAWSENINVRYWKQRDGHVRLRGRLAGGTAATTAFTLPAGYRPSTNLLFVTLNAFDNTVSFITVNTDGTVVPASAGSKNPTLDSICFRVDA